MPPRPPLSWEVMLCEAAEYKMVYGPAFANNLKLLSTSRLTNSIIHSHELVQVQDAASRTT
eukprot:1143029-Pelagomonas_calceolata.AAC.3